CRQPERFVAVDGPGHLASVSRPPHVVRACALSPVRVESVLVLLFPPLNIPPMPSRHATKIHAWLNRINSGRARNPIEEGLPGFSSFFRAQSVRNHDEAEHVIRTDVRLLAPMIVKEIVPIKADEVAH